MKVGVYDRYWATMGGGEKYAAHIAAALAPVHEIELLGPDAIDLEELHERLGVDLRHVATRRLGGDGAETVEAASSRYDVFFNCTYLSGAPSSAGAGVYVTHFPTRVGLGTSAPRRLAMRAARRIFRTSSGFVRWEAGCHPLERSGSRVFRWTDGAARLAVALAPGATTAALRLALSAGERGSRHATVEVEGSRAVEVDLPPEGVVRLVVPVQSHNGGPARVRILSEARQLDPSDSRLLGVQVHDVGVGRLRLARLGVRLALLGAETDEPWFLQSYDLVIANSEFTRQWIRHYWRSDSEVLHPAVDPIRAQEKEPIIVSVGRFFDFESGHSKKQVELVDAFRLLTHRGVAKGWELHLVGGVHPKDEGYLRRVERAAEGLYVVLHANAPGEVLRELYGRASLYWHAAGLGEDLVREPHRAEHFGISTVEAMSAGAVPIVFDGGGQAEIVEDGVNGFVFRSAEQLIERTASMIGDPALRLKVAEEAQRRARAFGPGRFADQLQEILGRLPTTHGN